MIDVQVIHPILGRVKRSFHEYDLVSMLYDWVGSLSSDPKFFQLYFKSDVLLPHQTIKVADKAVVMMRECDAPVPLSEDDKEVTFLGFGDEMNDSAGTSNTIPEIILADESSSSRLVLTFIHLNANYCLSTR